MANRVFALVLHLETRHFHECGEQANAHVCDRLRSAASFGYMANFYLLVPHDLLGRELFVLIVFGQSRPSSSKCIQLHAFFISRKSLEVSARTRVNAR